MDTKDWKKKLAELLREHPDIGSQLTGQVEVNMSLGGVTKIYRIETEVQQGGAVRVTTKQELK